jgi:murein L,D-transpeptidase YcbB/YkuD
MISFWPTLLAATLAAQSVSSAVPDTVETIALPPSGERGLDMIVVDAEAMPQEPELAKDLPPQMDESWSGAPVDLFVATHHLYTDLRRSLVRYQMKWSGLPLLPVATAGPVLKLGSSDPRVPILRQRLGVTGTGNFDAALAKRVAEFQAAHGIKADGIAGPGTLAALNRGPGWYERQIMLNMERARRLPPEGSGERYVLVDAGSATLYMYDKGRPVDSMKVIVGTAKSETPMMAALMRYAAINPFWNIPPDLVQNLVAPRVMAQGVTYLTERRYEVLSDWSDQATVVDPSTIDWQAVADGRQELRVRQLPGGSNSMGAVKFMLPNHYGIYLHDTPNKALFAQDDRWLSNGCVRLEDAARLEQWVFGTSPTPASPDAEERVDLAKPIPVYITYMTVGVGTDGPQFRADPYNRDAPLLAKFEGAPPAAAIR